MTIRQIIGAAAALLASVLILTAPARAGMVEITGTVNWDRATRIPAGGLLEIRLLDVGRGDEALEIASLLMVPPEQPSARFRLFYDEAMIARNGAYRLTARVTVGKLVLMESLLATPVITSGSFADPEIMMERITVTQGDDQPSPVGRNWVAVSIMGEPVKSASQVKLTLGDDGMATGSTGCNTFRARYEASPEVLNLGHFDMTRRGCMTPIRKLEKRALSAFRDVRGWRLNDGELILTDLAGGEMMRFEEGY